MRTSLDKMTDRIARIDRLIRTYGVVPERPPVAFKYADPVDEARWIYDADEAREVESEDPSLIIWI